MYILVLGMSLDDPRVEWIRQRVCSAFYMMEKSCFEDLLSRGDGEDGQKIIRFLNEVTEDELPSTLLFSQQIREEEVEVPINIGKQVFFFNLLHPRHIMLTSVG